MSTTRLELKILQLKKEHSTDGAKGLFPLASASRSRAKLSLYIHTITLHNKFGHDSSFREKAKKIKCMRVNKKTERNRSPE